MKSGCDLTVRKLSGHILRRGGGQDPTEQGRNQYCNGRKVIARSEATWQSRLPLERHPKRSRKATQEGADLSTHSTLLRAGKLRTSEGVCRPRSNLRIRSAVLFYPPRIKYHGDCRNNSHRRKTIPQLIWVIQIPEQIGGIDGVQAGNFGQF